MKDEVVVASDEVATEKVVMRVWSEVIFLSKACIPMRAIPEGSMVEMEVLEPPSLKMS